MYRLKQVDISPYGRCLRLESITEEKKKTVVKEAEQISPIRISSMTRLHEFMIPVNAKNVKCTYEIEE